MYRYSYQFPHLQKLWASAAHILLSRISIFSHRGQHCWFDSMKSYSILSSKKCLVLDVCTLWNFYVERISVPARQRTVGLSSLANFVSYSEQLGSQLTRFWVVGPEVLYPFHGSILKDETSHPTFSTVLSSARADIWQTGIGCSRFGENGSCHLIFSHCQFLCLYGFYIYSIFSSRHPSSLSYNYAAILQDEALGKD